VLGALREAVERLTYPSESDAPFDGFLDEHAASAAEVAAAREMGSN
jgi:hypothetical protein